MSSTEWGRVYKRLVILGLLLVCCFFFNTIDKGGTGVNAARCIEDCQSNETLCTDNCTTSCDEESTDAECAACMSNCFTQSGICLQGAISCPEKTSRPAMCEWGYSNHCPVIGGVVKCDDPSAHSGYYAICPSMIGSCVHCPDHEYCTGSNGLPACP